ncbi:MAG: transketolase [Halobacteriovoraceae bacterium]|jgi:transketolase|nr:transketolase [Halobacteriovoraceae bacterium]MBT5094587.1 transketolase [Halobacteriovoraceae bacterium]
MRKRGLAEIFKLASANKEILFIGSDLGEGTIDEYQSVLPKQYFMEGISEANLIGMAAGLAMEGKQVFVNTIATFLTRRCFDQLAMDVCTSNLNVRLYANGGGVVYAPLGPTHMAVDDISLMRSLPGMTIIHPSDAEEMARAIQASESHQGPIYFRLARGGETVTSRKDLEFEIGKPILLKKPKEVLLLANGTMVYRALEVSKILEAEGIGVGVLNVHTVKPFDKQHLIPYLSEVEAILSIEEHNIDGGLGSATAEIIAEYSGNRPRFKRLGFPNIYPDYYGQQDLIISKYGLNILSIAQEVRSLL